ncbi:MAG: COG1361 S-layer family protein, partial [Halarchaeum sp.]
YDYTSTVYYGGGSPQYNDGERTETFEVPVVVRDRATFDVVNATSDVSVGQRGTYTVRVKNTGSEAATNASVAASSPSADVSFGGAGGTAASVAHWAPNETKTLTYSAAVADTTGVRNYSVSFDVTFDDAAGVTRHATRLSAGLRPNPEQTFAIGDVNADLRIGRSDGSLTGTVTNTGPEAVHDAALVLAGNGSGVTFDQREYALPALEPGESARFSLDGGTVPNTANVSSLPVSFAVQYDNAYDDRYTSDVHEVTVAVAPHADKFDVTAVNAIPAGTRGDTPKDSDWSRLTVQVTNDGDETVRDVRPSLVFDSQYYQRPVESNQRTGVIGTLEPGETKNVTYAVSAAAAAGGTTYPLDVAVSYEEPNGVARRTATYTVPLRITQSSSLPLLPIGGGAIVLLGLLLGGFIWYRRDPDE